MRDRYQGGSLAGFVIIGALLTLVLVGGLYGLSRYNAQKANEEVAADDKRSDEKADEAKKDVPASEEKLVDPNDATPTSGRQSNTPPAQSNNKPVATTPAPSTTSQLPQTGPADSIMTIVALGALVFAGAHYVRSRSQQ